jgi:hypothetical protein
MRFFQIASLLIAFVSGFVNAQREIVSPDWVFGDDFEGAFVEGFWRQGVYTVYGGSDTTNTSNKVLVMRYVPNSEGDGDSWAENDFRLGINAKQLTVSFDMYVPKDYVHIENNHKLIYFWSGQYGTAAANVSVSSEMWGRSGGANPSVYVGVDGSNYGHAMLSSAPVFIEDRQGSWMHIDVYLELASTEGDYGVFEIYKNGRLYTSTHHPDLQKAYKEAPNGENLIKYSQRGNFIDQGTLMGWANGATNGGFLVETRFLIDNFKIAARTEIGTVITKKPLPPANPHIILNNQ